MHHKGSILRLIQILTLKLLKKPAEFLKFLAQSNLKVKTLLLVLGILYYFYRQSKKTKIERIFKPTEFNKKTIELLEPCLKDFKPTIYLPTAFTQIVKGELAKNNYTIKYEAQKIVLPDEEEITAEWYPPEYASMDPETPIIAFILGICGHAYQGYCKVLAHMVKDKGWRVAIINRRGFGGQKLKTKKFMHKEEDQDIHSALLAIKEVFELAPIYLMGISAGANWSTRYLGILKEHACADACVAISNPYNVGRISFSMSQNFWGNFFSRHIAAGLKGILLSHISSPHFEDVLRDHYQDVDICLKEINNRKTCWEFDEFFSTKFCGRLKRARECLRLLLSHFE